MKTSKSNLLVNWEHREFFTVWKCLIDGYWPVSEFRVWIVSNKVGCLVYWLTYEHLSFKNNFSLFFVTIGIVCRNHVLVCAHLSPVTAFHTHCIVDYCRVQVEMLSCLRLNWINMNLSYPKISGIFFYRRVVMWGNTTVGWSRGVHGADLKTYGKQWAQPQPCRFWSFTQETERSKYLYNTKAVNSLWFDNNLWLTRLPAGRDTHPGLCRAGLQ